jgi:hypothetical protein
LPNPIGWSVSAPTVLSFSTFLPMDAPFVPSSQTFTTTRARSTTTPTRVRIWVSSASPTPSRMP